MTDDFPTYDRNRTYYLPADWMDETLPNLAAAPTDFVEQDAGGQWWLRLPVGDIDRDDPHYQTEIEPDHAYSWMERRMFGAFSITVKEDGSWSGGETIPAEANCFAHADNWDEEIFESLEEFVERGNPDSEGKRLDAGDYDVEAWFWSDEISMMFEVIDGKPSFRTVGHA